MILFISPFQRQKWKVDEDALDFKFIISQEKFINNLKWPYGSWLIPLAGGWVLENGCCRTGHGDHRPTIVCKAIHSPPSLDLWSLARARRGGGKPRERRGGGAPSVYLCNFTLLLMRFLKPIKLQSESIGFRLWKHGFQGLNSRVSQPKTHAFANEKYQLWKL